MKELRALSPVVGMDIFNVEACSVFWSIESVMAPSIAGIILMRKTSRNAIAISDRGLMTNGPCTYSYIRSAICIFIVVQTAYTCHSSVIWSMTVLNNLMKRAVYSGITHCIHMLCQVRTFLPLDLFHSSILLVSKCTQDCAQLSTGPPAVMRISRNLIQGLHFVFMVYTPLEV